MYIGQFVKKTVVLLFCMCLSLTPEVSAEHQTITATGSYTMGDGESKRIASERAVHEAENSALEQAGVYLERYSETKNMQISQDEIKVLAGRISERVGEPALEYDVMNDNSIKISATVTVIIDTDSIQNIINRQKETVTNENIELTESYKENKEVLDGLKGDLEKSTGENASKLIREKILNNELEFQLLQDVEEAKKSKTMENI